MKEIEAKLAEAKEREQALKVDSEKMQKRYDDLEQEKTKLETMKAQEISERESKIAQAKEETAAGLRTELGHKQGEVDKLHEALKEEKAKLEGLQGENTELRRKVEEVKAHSSQGDNAEEMEKAKEQLGAAKKELEDCMAEKDSLENGQKKELSDRDDQIEKLTSDCAKAETGLADLQKEVETSKERVAKLEGELATKDTAIEAMKKERASAKKQLDEATSKLTAAEAAVKEEQEKKRLLQEEHDAFQSQCESLDEEIKNVKFAKAKVERDNQLLEKKVVKREAELKTATEERDSLRKRVEELEHAAESKGDTDGPAAAELAKLKAETEKKEACINEKYYSSPTTTS